MGKKLNEGAMESELSGSAFFRPAAPARQDESSPPLNDAPLRPQGAPVPPDNARVDQSPVSSSTPGNAGQTGIEEEEPSADPADEHYSEPVKQRSNVGTNEWYPDRKKIRHTFDIYEDQLLSLRAISVERTNEDPRHEKVLLGDLIQEALDMFIAKERNKE